MYTIKNIIKKDYKIKIKYATFKKKKNYYIKKYNI